MSVDIFEWFRNGIEWLRGVVGEVGERFKQFILSLILIPIVISVCITVFAVGIMMVMQEVLSILIEPLIVL